MSVRGASVRQLERARDTAVALPAPASVDYAATTSSTSPSPRRVSPSVGCPSERAPQATVPQQVVGTCRVARFARAGRGRVRPAVRRPTSDEADMPSAPRSARATRHAAYPGVDRRPNPPPCFAALGAEPPGPTTFVAGHHRPLPGGRASSQANTREDPPAAWPRFTAARPSQADLRRAAPTSLFVKVLARARRPGYRYGVGSGARTVLELQTPSSS
jgi:hypothetical protein